MTKPIYRCKKTGQVIEIISINVSEIDEIHREAHVRFNILEEGNAMTVRFNNGPIAGFGPLESPIPLKVLENNYEQLKGYGTPLYKVLNGDN